MGANVGAARVGTVEGFTVRGTADGRLDIIGLEEGTAVFLVGILDVGTLEGTTGAGALVGTTVAEVPGLTHPHPFFAGIRPQLQQQLHP